MVSVCMVGVVSPGSTKKQKNGAEISWCFGGLAHADWLITAMAYTTQIVSS